MKLNDIIKIEDDVNLIALFQTKSTNEIKDYMDKHYKDLAKTYNLENPRTTLDDSMVRLAKRKLKTLDLKIKVSHIGKLFIFKNRSNI